MNMMRQTSRIMPMALAAVLVLGACGAADDDGAPEPPAAQPDEGSELRAPTPIEFTSGGAGSSGDRVATGASESAIAADDMMIAPYFAIDYVLGEGLVAPTDDTGYVFEASGPATVEEVSALAAALGVEGEPELVDDGYAGSWRVGPEDGTAPSLWVSSDAQRLWNYSSAWALQTDQARVACAVSVDSDGNETVEDCPEPEPPANVPTAEQAEARAADLLSALGVDPATVTFDTYADGWFASVTASDSSDLRNTVLGWGFGFGAEGVLQYASGSLATPQPVGPYPLVDVETAFRRLQDQTFGGFRGGPATDTPAIAVAEEPPAEPDVMESGEPAMEPLPVDGELPEPEAITVTLTSMEADLWWAWDVDGNVWLLPAYRFIGDDGGWYTVPAVTDEFLIQVDPPVVIDEPIPVEPDDGIGDGAEPLPLPAVPAEELAGLVGMSVDEVAAKAESGGWTVRVVERDGEDLPVTADFSETRLNLAVVTVDGVEQVVRIALDDGTVIAEVTIEPVVPAEPVKPTEPVEPGTDPSASPVPIVGVHEGVAFYPGCGDETLTFEGVTWYQVHESDYPDVYAAIFAVDRLENVVESAPRGFARVAPPGPGDDIGTLVIWEDGVARFVSESGNLTAWLVDDVLTYDWVC